MTAARTTFDLASAVDLGRRIGQVLVLALSLGACASFSPDGGLAPVTERVAADIGKNTVKIIDHNAAQTARERITALLADPLSAESAAQIALYNNRGLQASYNVLGISEAAFVEASLPPNPTLSLERIAGGGVVTIEARLAADLLRLLTLPVRRGIGEAQFRAAQHRATEATFRVAAEARRAFYRATAAAILASYLEEARTAAEAAAELTRQLGETGAATKLDQARANSLQAEVLAQLNHARLTAAREREALTRVLGVWASDAEYRLPDRLPDLPAELRSGAEIEAEAIRRRVDLAAARIQLEASARALGLTEATRFISLLGVEGIRERERGHGETVRSSGFEVILQIPIFDFGEVGVRRARESYMEAVNRLTEMAVNIRSQARTAYQAYRISHDVARLYLNRILPLRRIVNEEVLLRYNGMLVDAFQLLTTAREGIATNLAAIGAVRDYFITEVDLQAAVIGGGDPAGATPTAPPGALPGAAGGH